MAARGKRKSFKIYSGVMVDEVVINGVPVMRRRSDDWFNATQMLKAAGLEKARRTRVLEGEIQNCSHVKIQGGCGKYQGTWVPYDVGVYIARKYGIEEDVFPILNRGGGGEGNVSQTGGSGSVGPHDPSRPGNYPSAAAHSGSSGGQQAVPSSSSSSAAPQSYAGAFPQQQQQQQTTEAPKSKKRRRGLDAGPDGDDQQGGDGDDSGGEEEVETSTDTESNRDGGGGQVPGPRRTYQKYGGPREAASAETGGAGGGGGRPGEGTSLRTRTQRYNRLMARRRHWAAQLLEHFYSDSPEVPRLFLDLPDGFDVDAAIDGEGHTSLHWAAALGRQQVVRHIVRTSHANAAARNDRGQTALMRAVSYANSYITRGFSEILSMLRETLPVADGDGRNVLHHIADTEPGSPMAPAARYYMEQVRALVLGDPRYYAETVNAADAAGETPLALAARARNETLARQLLSMGAGPASPSPSSSSPSPSSSLADDGVPRGPDAWDYRYYADEDAPGAGAGGHQHQHQHHRGRSHSQHPDHCDEDRHDRHDRHHPPHLHALRQQPDRATARTAVVRNRAQSGLPPRPRPPAPADHHQHQHHHRRRRHRHHQEPYGGTHPQQQASPAARPNVLSEVLNEATKQLVALVNERFDWLEKQLADVSCATNGNGTA